MDPDPDEHARRLAAASAATDPTGWFDRLYRAARDEGAIVPWDRGAPHPLLLDWAKVRAIDGAGRRALVVGAGPGHDAELIASRGYAVTAFDVSETAVAAARARHPDTAVDYAVADLLAPPPAWRGAFDLVVESMTVQSMPRAVRERATAGVAGFVAPGGTLLVIASALGPGDDPAAGPPWPLTRDEVEAFAAGGLELVSLEDHPVPDEPALRRWRAELRAA